VEQNVESANLKVVPKTIANRRAGVKASYPQLTADGGTLNAGAASFNRKVLAMTQKAIKDFEPGPEVGKNSLERNYNLLLVTDDQLSEISSWGLTPKGLVVYFDFAHAIAVFDRTVVPYSVIKTYLKPNGPAARFQ